MGAGVVDAFGGICFEVLVGGCDIVDVKGRVLLKVVLFNGVGSHVWDLCRQMQS
jgi:hypothetical protein